MNDLPLSRGTRATSQIKCAARSLGGILTLATALALLAPVSARGSPADTSGAIVIDHVTVVDTHTGKLSPDRAVVIEGASIARIVSARGFKPGTATVVDGRGKYLVPGFNDMHAHPLNDGGVERLNNLTLMLANGVTGFRQMSGSADLLRDRAAGTLMPNAPVPELLAMPGDVLIRPVAPTPEAGVAAVDRQKAQGADFIKVVDVAPATFFAIGAEARKVGLPFLGHLPSGVDAAQASAAGYRSIEHLGPFATILLSCSSDEAAIRQAMANRPAPVRPSMIPAMALQALQTAATEPLLTQLADPSFFPLLDRMASTYDDAKCRDLSRTFIANGTWQSPTLIRVKTIDFGDDPQFVTDPHLRYVSSQRRALWAMVAHRLTTTLTPAQRAILSRFWLVQLRMLRTFDQAGVMMIAGTDVGGQWDIPGFSLHQDFDLLAADGIAPLKVLQMTTLNAAMFLGRENSMGSVGEGKTADLVLLEGDPTKSVQNLHKIAGVVRAGRYYGARDLETMLRETEERIGAVPSS